MPNLANKDICTGCTACMNICPKQCISMKQDNSGFEYPEINTSQCIDCGKCENCCPVLNEKGRYVLPLVFAAYSLNESMRMESSSGGVFSEIAKNILGKKGIVYGAVYNENFEIEHIAIKNTHDLLKLRGAKYAQSRLGTTYRDILGDLSSGQFVLFSGTPCQVAGLKMFLKKDYDNLFCVDFVCHGVPSPMVWKEYIKYRMREDGENKIPLAINLRNKKTGWSKYGYSNVFQYAEGRVHSIKSSDSLFMKLFVGDYINRKSCASCFFKGYGRISDITLGDFWGIWDIAPEMDDDKGTSLVLVQSDRGKRIWSEIKEKMVTKEVSLEEASKENSSILVSSASDKKREEVLMLIKSGKIGEISRMLSVQKKSLIIRLKNKVNYFKYRYSCRKKVNEDL